MKQYEMFELSFQGEEPKGSFAVVDLKAEFALHGDTAEEGERKETLTVKGFYAGNGTYKVRFYPAKTGIYTWKVTGAVCAKGQEECVPGDGKGIVRAVGTHFEYDCGEIFKPFGTTIYAMNHQEEELRQTTFLSLKKAPFNKVRHCVFPKHYDYNHNEPPYYAFEKDAEGRWDVNRPCFAFWDHFEEGIFALQKMGIQSDLILFHPYDNWGFAKLSMEENRIYLDYLLRRFSAIPSMWWSMANEYDLCLSKTMEDWHDIESFVAENDPYHHLLSNHNCFDFYDFTGEHITHQSVQTILVQKASDWIREIKKPLCYDECCYEGNLPLTWGNISGWEMANRFWAACAQGAYATHGEVFLSEDEVLWWAKGGILKGESPERIAFLKKIMDEIPGALEPWQEYSDFDLQEYTKNHTPEELEALQNSSIVQRYWNKSEYDDLVDKFKEMNFMGHLGEQVYIGYYGRHCNGVATWKLPEDRQYRIEIIDMWDMTRKETMTGVSGKIQIQMPGKEGIAILAKEM